MIDIFGDGANPRQGGNVKCRYCGGEEHIGSGCKLPDLPKVPTGQLAAPRDSEGMKTWKLSGRDPATYSKCGVVECEDPPQEGSTHCKVHDYPKYKVAQATANARQVGGDHYMKQAIQPWDYIVANKIGFLAGCAIKYISRYNSPGAGGIRDLEKAKHFLEKLIEVEAQIREDKGMDKL
jgi:hypothetical protein